MRITVAGGCGAWPEAGRACSGYLVEREGFRVLIDPGYGTFAALRGPVDAVLVSHGHPDHCADLNPLLRERALGAGDPPVLPVHAPSGALDAVLALDAPHMLAGAYRLVEFSPGDRFEIGPFAVETRLLPHFVPNAGMRLSAGGRALAYTGDTGPSPLIAELAADADVLLAEATFPDRVEPAADAPYLSTAAQAGQHAREAGAGRLVLTHLWPGVQPEAALAAARPHYTGRIDVALPGLVLDLG